MLIETLVSADFPDVWKNAAILFLKKIVNWLSISRQINK
jgi:hypothetical protein